MELAVCSVHLNGSVEPPPASGLSIQEHILSSFRARMRIRCFCSTVVNIRHPVHCPTDDLLTVY
jgi:hypothetical protein